MNKHYLSVRGAFVLAFACLLTTLTVQAQTNFGAFQDNNFLNANNWSNGLPGPENPGTIVGGVVANINSNHTVNYSLTSFGGINLTATLVVNGTLNNFSGSVLNINGAGNLTNNGTMDQRGALNISAAASFTVGATGTYSSTGVGYINNQGNVAVAGVFNNLGTIDNFAILSINGTALFTNNTTINNAAQVKLNSGTLTNLNGANINNLGLADFVQAAGASLINQGTLTNDGSYQNSGILTNSGSIYNNGLFQNKFGGSLTNNFFFRNFGFFNNEAGANILNEFEFLNDGTFTNNTLFDNGALLKNSPGGLFNNVAGAEVNNQFGATIHNNHIFNNAGTINSVGGITNIATFNNTGTVQTNTGGAIVNFGDFNNDNLLSNLEEITNQGTFTNNGQLQNESGGVFTNEGTLINAQPARISNEFDLINNENLINYGTIENGVRIFNNDYFENNGYLINIGDFVNGLTGTFKNTMDPTGAGSNGGVLENTNGGVFTNLGVINNYNEIFNLECSSFINKGIINNYYWWTNKGLFFNFGTFNELPYHQMNMDGGVEITGPTSSLVCQSTNVSLDEFGKAKITGSAIATAAFADCIDLTLLVNGQIELNYTCANIGSNPVTLKISDRSGNSVTCSTTVTIVDDLAPEFKNCPGQIIVVASGTTTPASWTPPTATDNCGPVNVTSTHQPGDLFPIGTTQVTYSATDGKGNSASPCTFPVIVVPQGDCADVLSVRQVTSTNDNCGSWCNGSYAATFGSGKCYTAGTDLIFVEYTNGTALLTGSILKNGERGFVDVCFGGRTTSAPSGSPKLELCLTQGGQGWTYYTSFSGTITTPDGKAWKVNRVGPAFQYGMGGNLQEPTKLGASGWFSFDNTNSHGDFNFRLSAPRDCQNSIYLEAECADQIGSSWKIVDATGASQGKALLPPNSNSYNYPPLNTADLVTFNVNVPQAGSYRIYARASTPNGSADSYWVRVNNGNWVKWNTINNSNYSNDFQWDLAGEWRGGNNDIPTTFQFIAGANTVQFSWREPYACLDKIFITSVAKQPTGKGGNATNCTTTPPPPPSCKEVLVKIKPDKYGQDITWNLKNSNGNIVASGGPYANWDTNLKTASVCLPDGCYTFQIKDSYGDGICCNYGDGYYEVKSAAGETLASSDGKYGSGETKTFCLNATPPPTACNRNALFIVGETNLNDSDAAVKSRLQGLGFTVTVVDDGACTTSQANGKGLILISSTSNSSSIGSKYTNVAVPVIVWEGWLMDDLKMTGPSADQHYGTASNVKKMTIQDGNHPIAQGASGDYNIFDDGQTATWGLPSSAATRIGYVPGYPSCVLLFTYDTGASMVGMNAPARRVGFYLHNSTANRMNSTGWQFFDRSVQWATGCDLGLNAAVQSTDLLKLKAHGDHRQVNLAWLNNTGFKNDFFIVEHSTDGRNFEVINEMLAYSEENTSTEAFQDFDTAPAAGPNYYRVSAQLLDGTWLHSQIQVVEIVDLVDYAVYPNPASHATNVNLDRLLGQQNVRIDVYDWSGRPMQHFVLDEVDTPDFQLDLTDLKSGNYTVVVTPEGRRPVTKKLIISK